MQTGINFGHWAIPVAILFAAVFLVFRASKRSRHQAPIAGRGFRNPSNGYTEVISAPFLWCLLFGCFYLAYKGAWLAAAMALVLAMITAGLSWLIFPFFAGGLVRTAYLRRGWVEVTANQ